MRRRREKVEVTRVLRGGEWNLYSNLAVVSFRCELVVEQDFESISQNMNTSRKTGLYNGSTVW